MNQSVKNAFSNWTQPTLLVTIAGLIYWTGGQVATMNSSMERLMEQQVVAKDDRSFLGERVQDHEYKLREHENRIFSLEEFKKEFK